MLTPLVPARLTTQYHGPHHRRRLPAERPQPVPAGAGRVQARPQAGQRRRADARLGKRQADGARRCARSPRATSASRSSRSRTCLRRRNSCPNPNSWASSARRRSGWETDPARATPMDVTSSLRSLLPYGRRSIGINQLDLEARDLPAAGRRSSASRKPTTSPSRPMTGSAAAPASPTSRTRSRSPTCSPTCTSTPQTMIAAILHDVIEDTPTPRTRSPTRFGNDVAELVDGVSKLDQIQFKSRAEAQAESFRKMLLAMVRDIRVIMVKLADRTHNMRTLGAMPPAKRRAIARETLEIYAPIANRLGMHTIKRELEDLGFRALYPRRYKVIETAVRKAEGQPEAVPRQDRRRRSKDALDEGRHRGARSRAARRTSTASTRRCGARRSRSHEIVDVYGFRIVVDKRRHLLPRARRRARRLQADAGPVQGLHRDPARQRLPVAAHHAVRAERHADRGADPHRGDGPASPRAASRRTGSTRSGGRTPRARRATARASGCSSWSRSSRAATPRNSSRASRSTCSRTRSTCSRRRARSAACRAARPASTSPTPCTPTSATAASPPRSTAAWCRCARRCATARRSRSSRRRARRRIRPGSTSSSRPRRAPSIRQYLKNLKRGEAVELGRRLLNQALEEFSLEPAQGAGGDARRGGARPRAAQRATSCSRRSASASASRRSSPAACCRDGRGRRRRRHAPARSRSPAPKAWSSPTRAAASRSRTTRSSRASRRGRGVVIHREACGNLASFRKQPEKWISGRPGGRPPTGCSTSRSGRGHEPHGRAGAGRVRDRGHADQHRPRVGRRARQRHARR